MKRCLTLMLFLFAGVMFASVASARPEKAPERRIVPVLVHVDSHGKVTDISPAYPFRPGMSRVLEKTLDKMITKPAMSHGHPISSQFVINLALDFVPQGNGKYGVKFSYVSSKPLPSGQWSWVHKDNHQLALQDRSNLGQPTEMLIHQQRSRDGAPRMNAQSNSGHR